MPKIEISTSDAHEFDEGAYKKAIEASKNIIDNLKAENKKLLDTSEMLRIANEELQRYIDKHKTAEPQKEAQNVRKRPFEDCDEDCTFNCDICGIAEDHMVGNEDDDTVDEAIDGLIRENLDMEGRIKGLEDALHIMCAWLKADVDKLEEAQKE